MKQMYSAGILEGHIDQLEDYLAYIRSFTRLENILKNLII